MLLVIDAGNTNITLGIFSEDKTSGTFRMKQNSRVHQMSMESHCVNWWKDMELKANRLQT